MASTPDLDVDVLSRNADETRQPLSRVLAGAIRARIRAGKYEPGEMFYSIRELAQTLGYAKNTIVKAYDELESDGLIVKRASGHYVTTDRRALSAVATIDDEVNAFRARLAALGFTEEEARAAIERAWRIK